LIEMKSFYSSYARVVLRDFYGEESKTDKSRRGKEKESLL